MIFCLCFHIQTHALAHIHIHVHTRVCTYNLITSTCKVILTPIPAKWGLFCILYFHIKILTDHYLFPFLRFFSNIETCPTYCGPITPAPARDSKVVGRTGQIPTPSQSQPPDLLVLRRLLVSGLPHTGFSPHLNLLPSITTSLGLVPLLYLIHFSIAVINHDQKQFGDRRICFILHSQVNH